MAGQLKAILLPEFSPDRLYPCYGITLRLNVFSTSTGSDWMGVKSNWVVEAISAQFASCAVAGHAESRQFNKMTLHLRLTDRHGLFISTDPPYYDNVGYADLSDFFYVWLRRSLQKVFPDLFATLASRAKGR